MKTTVLSGMIACIMSNILSQSPPSTWTSNDGRTIQATMVRLDGDNVVLQRSDGTQFSVPLNKLSADSQAAATNGRKAPTIRELEQEQAFAKGATFYIWSAKGSSDGLAANDVRFYVVQFAVNPAREWKPFSVKIETKNADGRSVNDTVKPAGATPGTKGQFIFGIMNKSKISGQGQGSVYLVAEGSTQRLSNTITVPIDFGK